MLLLVQIVKVNGKIFFCLIRYFTFITRKLFVCNDVLNTDKKGKTRWQKQEIIFLDMLSNLQKSDLFYFINNFFQDSKWENYTEVLLSY